jgi:hypothetical protein
MWEHLLCTRAGLSRSAATSKPRGVSMATGIGNRWLGGAPGIAAMAASRT